MKALAYLTLTQIKNRILSLKKKPGLLILYSVLTLIVVGSFVLMIIFSGETNAEKAADERIIYLIISALGLLFVYTFVTTGLSTGSSLFNMPDVGLLFVAPISSKKILFYGLLNTMGKSLLASVFIFYQIGNLRNVFDYGFKEIFILFIIYASMLVSCQLLAIGIYIFSNGNPSRKNLVKAITYTLYAALVIAYLVIQRQQQTGLLETILRLVSSEGFAYFPVAGWSVMLFAGVAHNLPVKIIISVVLFLIMGAVIIILLTSGKADYYESVLVSTETSYQIRKAAREGRNVPQTNSKKIKVRDNAFGIGKGSRAMAIFYKHLLEHKRKSRLIFIDGYTVFMMIAAGMAGYYFRTYALPELAYYGVLATAVYFQYFLTVMGKLKQELTKPYIYLIPDSSLRKVFAASLSSLIKPCVDGCFIFGTLAAVSGHNLPECAFFALAYAASGAVFVGLTILYQRVLGGQLGTVLKVFIGMGLFSLVLGPAIAPSIVLAIILPDSLRFLCTLPYSVISILFAVLLFVACGNLIDKSEYTGSAAFK